MKIIIATLCFVTLICNNAMHAQAWQTQDPNFPYKTTPFDVICPNTTDAWTFGFEYDSSFTSFSQVNYTLSTNFKQQPSNFFLLFFLMTEFYTRDCLYPSVFRNWVYDKEA